MTDNSDLERNRLSSRLSRYARVGTNIGGVAARMAGARVLGQSRAAGGAADLAAALGGLKGPLMKVAQLLATIPDAVPPEYAAELMKLQSEAPPMGAAFVRRRMMSELGADWRDKFAEFDLNPSAAASLGQVHQAVAHDGMRLACKLQYPEMASAVEADLAQLRMLLGLHRRMDQAIDTSEIAQEIGDRVREELDYRREAKHAALYAHMLADVDEVSVPSVRPELSTGRLLTLRWLDGRRLMDFRGGTQEERNGLATAIFKAWWHPFAHFGVIHGDPHFGNYTVRENDGAPSGINLLDYGCIRIFPPRFVGGVVDLYHGLRTGDGARVVHAYETWGFRNLSKELVDILNVWAGFIYGPLLTDKVQAIAGEGVSPTEFGRKQAFHVHRALKEKGPVTVPREFVFMDRAAIGLGGAFLHLKAELNFYRLFNEEIAGFSPEGVDERQKSALRAVNLLEGSPASA
jgi:predicted unusual protein kinase regulating ubiquinone biosynthesis (AarF/ABC1/UbiB family)